MVPGLGSGGSRHSPRRSFLAAALNRAGLGTLLVDLLTEYEELGRPPRLEAVPLALDHCPTRLADPVEMAWIARGFRAGCAPFGTTADQRGGRLLVDWDGGDG